MEVDEHFESSRGKIFTSFYAWSKERFDQAVLTLSVAAAHRYTAVPATPSSAGVDSGANEWEVQSNDKQATPVHSPEYALQHQIFAFLLILLLWNDVTSCCHLCDFSGNVALNSWQVLAKENLWKRDVLGPNCLLPSTRLPWYADGMWCNAGKFGPSAL